VNCKPCPYWKKGKGSKECLYCDKIKDSAIFANKNMPRQGATRYAIRLNKEHLENLKNPESPDLMFVYKRLRLITPKYATVLLQTTILDMSLVECGSLNGVNDDTIARWVKIALEELRVLL
jgi:hypothetical protein